MAIIYKKVNFLLILSDNLIYLWVFTTYFWGIPCLYAGNVQFSSLMAGNLHISPSTHMMVLPDWPISPKHCVLSAISQLNDLTEQSLSVLNANKIN